jgi:hypothetical protein
MSTHPSSHVDAPEISGAALVIVTVILLLSLVVGDLVRSDPAPFPPSAPSSHGLALRPHLPSAPTRLRDLPLLLLGLHMLSSATRGQP